MGTPLTTIVCMASENLESKARRWLETTGFPLEMRVAREARRAGPLWVDQSRPFVDPETGKLRETDVVVGMGPQNKQADGYVFLVVECKAKPAPWIVFDDGDLPSDDADLRLARTPSRSPADAYGDAKDVIVVSGAFTGNTLLKPSRMGFGVIEATFKDRPSERNAAWDAVRSAVSAAHGVIKEFSSQQIASRAPALVAFPVVVTSGGLFRSFLDGDSIAVEKIDRGEVIVRTEATSEDVRCLVVSEDAWPSMLKDAQATTAVVGLGT